jgi:glucoamylase
LNTAKLTPSPGTRDSAIAIDTLLDAYADEPASKASARIAPVLHGYALVSSRLQHTPNPSGAFSPDLSGLGEPKFRVDGRPFPAPWGRPQRDGPALRALALMKYLRVFNGTTAGGDAGEWREEEASRMAAEQAVRADLQYVARYWPYAGFDLWEEVEGLHFSTAMVQHRALREGASFAFDSASSAVQDPAATAQWYEEHAAGLRRMLRRGFWSGERGHLVHTLDTGRSGLDCATLLGSLHGSSPADDGDAYFAAGGVRRTAQKQEDGEDEEPSRSEVGEDAASPFPPASAEVLATLLALSRDMRSRHPINRTPADELSPGAGVGVGRYPEDRYDGYSTSNTTTATATGSSVGGGNPWFLCTLAAAETLHRAAYTLRAMPPSSSLHLTHHSLPFYRALLPGLLPVYSSRTTDSATSSPLVLPRTSPLFSAALARLRDAGDAFLRVARAHADQQTGAMSEQFDSVTGYMRGARDLGWSYAAFLRAARARRRLLEG